MIRVSVALPDNATKALDVFAAAQHVSDGPRPPRSRRAFANRLLAHLGLGRAYAMAGHQENARTAYKDFFALWKDADPGLSILEEAKAEYVKLR